MTGTVPVVGEPIKRLKYIKQLSARTADGVSKSVIVTMPFLKKAKKA